MKICRHMEGEVREMVEEGIYKHTEVMEMKMVSGGLVNIWWRW